MNITYRVIDPTTGRVHDQGQVDTRRALDRRHFDRLQQQQLKKRRMVVTMATGHQSSMFEGEGVRHAITASGT